MTRRTPVVAHSTLSEGPTRKHLEGDMKRFLSTLCVLMGVAAFGGTLWANDEPPQPMPGKILIIKSGSLAKFIAKPISPAVFVLPTAANDPTVEGASLRIQELVGADELSTTGSLSTSLP